MSRGMRMDSKLTTNLCSGLDINYLKNNGYFKEGHVVEGTMTWSSRNTKRITDQVELKGTSSAIELNYIHKNELMRYTVEIVYSSCNYGGKRPWFRCPNITCNKRVGKLYRVGKYFCCRHCHNLAYETQNMSEPFRLLEQVQKIRERLGGTLSTMDPFPSRPKGMHMSTYLKLHNRYQHLSSIMWGSLAKGMGIA